MKKTIYTAFFLLSMTGIVHAQVTKGKLFLGGTVAYSRGKAENSDNINYIPVSQHYLTITPAIGKVIKENLVLGIYATAISQEQKFQNPVVKAKTESYGGGIFLRKYVSLVKKFYFFGHAAAGYAKSSSSQLYASQPYNRFKGWDVNASLYPGLAFAVTKKFHIEAGFSNLVTAGYGHTDYESTDLQTGAVFSSKQSAFNISTSLGNNGGFAIGFRLLL